MTTAHRPTWTSALGSGTNPSGNVFSAQSTKVSNRDAAGMLSIKTRKAGQGTIEERPSRKEMREELERKEKKAKDERDGKEERPVEKKEEKRRPTAIQDNPFPEDADEDAPPSPSEKSEKEEDDDDDEDTEELMRELAKIKKERQEEEEREKELKAKQDDRSKRDEVMQGNPLVASGNLSLKRKWDDDTVFKNQARTIPKEKARFINDSVRSDFHRKFLNKYVWVDGVAH
uniref:Cwf15/Cwc15 cell cycle control protein n=1 Tax=Alexandrium andersonii TaxID=327968 RepID=A0A7S2IZ34_9DINO|mmetsp:Transcript_90848/g.203334  ORF Transcript_90848/g.203334 Transcript_90848/m.203334 type:complete len:230 (+) Transcript_90848:105-794(+)